MFQWLVGGSVYQNIAQRSEASQFHPLGDLRSRGGTGGGEDESPGVEDDGSQGNGGRHEVECE